MKLYRISHEATLKRLRVDWNQPGLQEVYVQGCTICNTTQMDAAVYAIAMTQELADRGYLRRTPGFGECGNCIARRITGRELI